LQDKFLLCCRKKGSYIQEIEHFQHWEFAEQRPEDEDIKQAADALLRGEDGALREGVRIYGAADYHNGLWLSFGCALIALITAPLMRETHCRQR